MARAIGLDIGSRTIKLVEVSGGPKGFRIHRVVTRPVPSADEAAAKKKGGEDKTPVAVDPDEKIAEVVAEIFDELKLPKEDVCVALGAGTTILREFPVPFKDDDQIRKVLRFEMENHLHSHAIEDMIVNGVKTGETRDGSRILGFATPKQDVVRRLAILRRAGVDPSSIDLDCTALYTACQALGLFEQYPNVVVLDVGALTTNVVRVCDGRPRYFRSVLLGLGALEHVVSRDLQVPLAEGRQQARLAAAPRPGDLLVPAATEEAPPEEKTLAEARADVVADRRSEFARKLYQETHRSISAVSGEPLPERVLVCGGGALLPGATDALSERLGLPVERLDLSGRAGWKDLGPDPEFAQAVAPPALGCALRMIGVNPLQIELLQDEFAPTNLFDVIKTPLAWAVTLLFLLMLGLTLSQQRRLKAEEARFNHAWKHAKEIVVAAEKAYLVAVQAKTETTADKETRDWLNSIPQDHTRFEAARSRLLSRHRELEGRLGLAKDITPVPSAVEVWVEIVRALSSVDREKALGTWFQITFMEITVTKAVLTIVVDDQTVFDTVRRVFETSEYFKKRARNQNAVVEPGSRTQSGGRWQQQFEFRFKEER